MTDENQEQDNIDAQLDMAVESADDIGFEDVEVKDEAVENEETTFDQAPSSHTLTDESVTQPNSGSQQASPEESTSPPADQVATGQNKDGDLVNQAGEIVASRGAERRVYERANKVQQENVSLQRQMEETRKELSDSNNFTNQPRSLNLSNEEAITGMQLMNQLKTDPVTAARQILQTAVSKGYNIQDIIGTAHGQQSPVNMGAIEQMISDKLAPITQREEAARQQNDHQVQMEQAKQQFISSHEFSDVHMEPIENLLKNNANMSPEAAYYEVKMYAAQNNFDFTQPLAPQIQAVQAQQNPSFNMNQPSKVMPNGNSSSSVVTQNPAQASGDDDWDAIVRTSMAESGMQV